MQVSVNKRKSITTKKVFQKLFQWIKNIHQTQEWLIGHIAVVLLTRIAFWWCGGSRCSYQMNAPYSFSLSWLTSAFHCTDKHSQYQKAPDKLNAYSHYRVRLKLFKLCIKKPSNYWKVSVVTFACCYNTDAPSYFTKVTSFSLSLWNAKRKTNMLCHIVMLSPLCYWTVDLFCFVLLFPFSRPTGTWKYVLGRLWAMGRLYILHFLWNVLSFSDLEACSYAQIHPWFHMICTTTVTVCKLYWTLHFHATQKHW